MGFDLNLLYYRSKQYSNAKDETMYTLLMYTLLFVKCSYEMCCFSDHLSLPRVEARLIQPFYLHLALNGLENKSIASKMVQSVLRVFSRLALYCHTASLAVIMNCHV